MTAANEALSTDKPAAVSFNTLAAAQELRKSGLEDRQAEAIVATISKAMSETVATKADLELQGTATRKDMELQGVAIRKDMELQFAVVRKDMELQGVAIRKDMELQFAVVRKDMELQGAEIRQDMELQFAAIRKDMEVQGAATRAEIESLKQSMASMQDKIIIRLGALMVSMTFLLLAFGPFYIRWVMSLMASQ